MSENVEAAAGNVQEINTVEEFDKIIEHNKLVVVDFTATWCGPCRMISPYFEELAAHPELHKKQVRFIKVDVDKLPNATAKAGVNAMPTFQFYEDGEKKSELVGASKERLKELIEEHVGVKLS